ncbi:hypothetical protein, partial [Aeromonas caviae]|uniref:hypothetical protein n=1 Tax=Aeromonas caviae TaxID=648 RepID=UPI0038D011A3
CFARSMPIVVAFMVVASLISGNLHSPLWHSDAVLGRGDHPINARIISKLRFILPVAINGSTGLLDVGLPHMLAAEDGLKT